MVPFAWYHAINFGTCWLEVIKTMIIVSYPIASIYVSCIFDWLTYVPEFRQMIRICFMDDFGKLHSRNRGSICLLKGKRKEDEGKGKGKSHSSCRNDETKSCCLVNFTPPPNRKFHYLYNRYSKLVAWSFGISEIRFGEFGDIHVRFEVCIVPET